MLQNINSENKNTIIMRQFLVVNIKCLPLHHEIMTEMCDYGKITYFKEYLTKGTSGLSK